jgi:hypothetical protein
MRTGDCKSSSAEVGDRVSALESIILLHDEVADLAASRFPQPTWGIETHSRGRVYEVTVLVNGAIVACETARALGEAHRRALIAFEQWRDDSPEGLTEALEVSLGSAQAEREAGGVR